MEFYKNLLSAVMNVGEKVTVGRNQSQCRMVPYSNICIYNHHVPHHLPVMTMRKLNYHAAIGEMLGYMRGYTHVDDFRCLGVKTWDANADDNPAWNNNPHKQGPGDLGQIYGAIGNHWQNDEGETILSYRDIVSKLRTREHDRGIIWSFWNPAKFNQGCLRPCMYSHQFTVINDRLYLVSNQRSADLGLGAPFNFFQCYFLLWVTAKLTGLKMGSIHWSCANPHLYENQIDAICKMLAQRHPVRNDTMHFVANVDIQPTDEWVDYVLESLHPKDFTLVNYKHHPAMKIPFTV